jgi:hypothetical protein
MRSSLLSWHSFASARLDRSRAHISNRVARRASHKPRRVCGLPIVGACGRSRKVGLGSPSPAAAASARAFSARALRTSPKMIIPPARANRAASRQNAIVIMTSASIARTGAEEAALTDLDHRPNVVTVRAGVAGATAPFPAPGNPVVASVIANGSKRTRLGAKMLGRTPRAEPGGFEIRAWSPSGSRRVRACRAFRRCRPRSMGEMKTVFATDAYVFAPRARIEGGI